MPIKVDNNYYQSQSKTLLQIEHKWNFHMRINIVIVQCDKARNLGDWVLPFFLGNGKRALFDRPLNSLIEESGCLVAKCPSQRCQTFR